MTNSKDKKNLKKKLKTHNVKKEEYSLNHAIASIWWGNWFTQKDTFLA
jgi:hypothetical protein